MKRATVTTWAVWTALSVPAAPMLWSFFASPGEAERLLHPSGEFAARFMIVAMLVTPLRMLFPKSSIMRWLMRNRRYFGVAAFGYAALHTVLYIVDMGSPKLMLDEIGALGIWTGWVAFLLFVPLAITSNDASQRWLLARWKQLQRLVYPAAVLALVHWIFIHNNLGAALVHFVPLALLEAWRIWKTINRRGSAVATQG